MYLIRAPLYCKRVTNVVQLRRKFSPSWVNIDSDTEYTPAHTLREHGWQHPLGNLELPWMPSSDSSYRPKYYHFLLTAEAALSIYQSVCLTCTCTQCYTMDGKYSCTDKTLQNNHLSKTVSSSELTLYCGHTVRWSCTLEQAWGRIHIA